MIYLIWYKSEAGLRDTGNYQYDTAPRNARGRATYSRWTSLTKGCTAVLIAAYIKTSQLRIGVDDRCKRQIFFNQQQKFRSRSLTSKLLPDWTLASVR